MQIDRETWLKVQPHFSTSLSLDARARLTWLAELEAREPALGPVLRRLIDNHEKAVRQAEFETIPRLAQPPPPVSPFAAGQMIGPFRLVCLLGRGGMGEVWRAAQTGGHIDREIALKLPLNVAHGTATAARFLRERSILASLSHPNIARLIDAGISHTDDGRDQPWMAMDLVTGEPLLQYLSARTTNCDTRIRLFRQILAAVAHAHQHLVVHRDLKPANILVDADGAVKLLDFGIAKLIDETSPANQTELTQAGARALTLRYAAPEQITGGPIGTTTDVWALGLILYEMLTGQPAYRAVREGRPFTELVITTEEIQLPSALKPGPTLDSMPAGVPADTLAGDLDAIILKALRKAPAQRYPSVEAFDADLAAHLERRPVAAREGTRRYLLGRYLARHRVLIGAGASVVIALATGLGVAETQRRQVVAEKARAEQHFQSVRALANTFMFDMHDDIVGLPGSLKARERLMQTALQYLDKLSVDVQGDKALTVEMAIAYRRLANLRGGTERDNLGAPGSAQALLEKSGVLFDSLGNSGADEINLQREMLTQRLDLARLLARQGEPRWKQAYAPAAELAARIARMKGSTLLDRVHAAMTSVDHAHIDVVMGGRQPMILDVAAVGHASMLRLAAEDPVDPIVQVAMAKSFMRIAEIHFLLKHPEGWMQKSLDSYAAAQRIMQALITRQPDNKGYRDFAGDVDYALFDALIETGRLDAADLLIGPLLASKQRRMELDPASAPPKSDFMRILARASELAVSRKKLPAAIDYARKGLAFAEQLPVDLRESIIERSLIAELQLQLGRALLMQANANADDRGRLAEACRYIKKTGAFVSEILARGLVDASDRHVIAHGEAAKRCGQLQRVN